MNYPTDLFKEVADLQFKKSKAYDSEELDRAKIKDDIEDKLRSYENIPGGMYRNVYARDNFVVKFAYNKLGVEENSAEIRNCTRISKAMIEDVVGDSTRCSGDKYIAEVLEYETGDHRWLVMERAEVTPNNVSWEMADDIDEALENAGIHIDEIEPANMGRIDDIPVVFDYGGT